MFHSFRPLRGAAFAAAALVVTTTTSANPLAPAPADVSAEIRALKRVYLECDRLANVRLLAFGEAAVCSQVTERLLKSGFGGDFDAMLAWWRAEKAASVLATTVDQP
ncbi:MAG TPA: hypothetical protein VFS37_02220 [Conexibacter sp.]|jgi:hypothetical protein|nr:hypothetical protein [Conexibacter sp.]